MINYCKNWLVRFRHWSNQSTNKKIFYAALIVALYTLAVKLVTVGKEVITAAKFGLADVLDAYLVAYVVPVFIISVIAGSLTAAFIPTFIKVREHEGKIAAQQLFSAVVFWSIILLIVATLVFGCLIPHLFPLLASGFSATKLALTTKIFYCLLPLMLMTGLTTLASAVLNAGERFAIAAVIPVITPVLTIIILLVFFTQLGIYSLVLGALFGVVCEFLLLIASLKQHGYCFMPRYYPADQHIKTVLLQCVPMVLGAIFLSGTSFVNQAMAAMLPSGSVAVLNYGSRVTMFFLSFGSYGLSTAILPHFSKMIAHNDYRSVMHTLKTYTWLILLVTLPIVILVFWETTNLTQLIFQRGAFNADATELVSKVQALFILQLPFNVIGLMFIRLISALRKNIFLLYGNIIYFSINIVLNLIFMRYLGVAGIALATSVIYLITAIYLFLVLRFYLHKQLLEAGLQP